MTGGTRGSSLPIRTSVGCRSDHSNGRLVHPAMASADRVTEIARAMHRGPMRGDHARPSGAPDQRRCGGLTTSSLPAQFPSARKADQQKREYDKREARSIIHGRSVKSQARRQYRSRARHRLLSDEGTARFDANDEAQSCVRLGPDNRKSPARYGIGETRLTMRACVPSLRILILFRRDERAIPLAMVVAARAGCDACFGDPSDRRSLASPRD